MRFPVDYGLSSSRGTAYSRFTTSRVESLLVVVLVFDSWEIVRVLRIINTCVKLLIGALS
jgi:hypothetical protein